MWGGGQQAPPYRMHSRWRGPETYQGRAPPCRSTPGLVPDQLDAALALSRRGENAQVGPEVTRRSAAAAAAAAAAAVAAAGAQHADGANDRAGTGRGGGALRIGRDAGGACVRVSVCLSVQPSVCLSVCLSVSACQSVRPAVRRSPSSSLSIGPVIGTRLERHART